MTPILKLYSKPPLFSVGSVSYIGPVSFINLNLNSITEGYKIVWSIWEVGCFENGMITLTIL